LIILDAGADGIHLSGGQKQRVSLARALYQDAEIYLLDDILSAVDVNVANVIFQRAIKEFLVKKKKTIIMTISQYKYLNNAERVILMNKGTPLEDKRALENYLADIKAEAALDQVSIEAIHLKSEEKGSTVAEQGGDPTSEIEKKDEGEIKISTLQLFINAMGTQIFLAIILGGILMQLSRGVFDVWLKDFTNSEIKNTTPSFFIISFNFTIFLLAGFSVVCCAYRAWIFAFGNLKASNSIFQRLVPNVLFAKMSFFDKNAVGSIIQRFSGDTTSLDDGFPFQWNIMLNNVIIFFRSVWVFTSEIPISIILLGPLLIMFNYVQKRYRAISREIKRLESIYAGIQLTHLSETKKYLDVILFILRGLKVIRATDKEKFMIDEYLEKLNQMQTIRCIIDAVNTPELFNTDRLVFGCC
jgi:ABC-type multidrug transport system fused ATPase/permease subunit